MGQNMNFMTKIFFLQKSKFSLFLIEFYYTKTPINANPMNAKPHFEKTIKCKNTNPFEKKTWMKFLEIRKKVMI
jgi:hypothetical protein